MRFPHVIVLFHCPMLLSYIILLMECVIVPCLIFCLLFLSFACCMPLSSRNCPYHCPQQCLISHYNMNIFHLSVSLQLIFTCPILICDPHHQLRHKSEIQKLRFRHNVIEENIGFRMLIELCFNHNLKQNYD